jgi:predicted AAA+ superfamily ATPase
MKRYCEKYFHQDLKKNGLSRWMRCELHYIRDKDGREVDFVTIVDGKVIDLIEVKVADGDVSSSLRYYAERLKPVRAVQIVGKLHRPFHSKGILVTNPIDFFTDPPWTPEYAP